jgi:hypothetical protein
MMNLLLALFLIVFEAIPEGLADRGMKTFAGILEALKLVVITGLLFLFFNGIIRFEYNSYIWYIVVGYILVRFSLFDLLYNLSRGVELNHVGTTKLYDKVYFSITKKMPFPYILFVKLVFITCGISMLLK